MPDPRQCQAIQDNDTDLKYSPNWELASKDPNGLSLTTHSTVQNGSSVVVDFAGTSIIVFGTVHPNDPRFDSPSASYAIDGQKAVTLALPTSNMCIPNQPFFHSHTLDPGPHNLTITVLTGGSPYILDYVWVCGPSSPLADLSEHKSKPSNRSHADAIIVGSVLGAVLFLIAVAASAWFFVRRRKKAQRLRKLHIAASPVSSWLHGQNNSGPETEIAFTSTESILRRNPTYSSTGDSKDAKSRAAGLGMPIITSFPGSPDSPESPPGLEVTNSTPNVLADHPLDGPAGLAPPPWTVRPRSRSS
ncbi:hypothetical protein C8Q77DRAFT_1067876 [Trametes polyzona]|nr:hypothetical protein C8Q77DRAFT_1067876 [Trametes polyzona]